MMQWTDIPGWYDYQHYYKSVIENYSGGLLVEVGCYLGKSLCALGQLVKESGKPFRVMGVDHCLGSGVENGVDHHHEAVKRGGRSFAGELWNNVVSCGLQDVVSLVVAESGRAAELFAPRSCTMVFLDASHDYSSLHRDIELWLPKVKLGGEIAGDDIGVPNEVNPVWPDVRRAVTSHFGGDWEHVPHDAWKYRVR